MFRWSDLQALVERAGGRVLGTHILFAAARAAEAAPAAGSAISAARRA